MRTLRVKGSMRLATCAEVVHPVGFFDGTRWVTRFWVDGSAVYTLEKSGREQVFARAKGFAA